ncbi:hypothetical protein EIB18_08345 [Caulobacter vibrioides]|uniref:Uncharacterized protein n=1 Tax=Caulobacter vibrioides (strain NA1000 / CB15N) TaxID=565050 RepID=A0A0H3C9X1_CAUVN|nr:hypothetical protein [Caulobacter vibrioides]YP_002517005.1 hypothetical protein CCNA_01632 [Caulobacter vibrioides NA1000]ACL95097.1 hypothetical protein CCNA_01632 [Caulobacter vibrioides NA1000]ATC28366.1 hypothetical protein CA607_08245 [Caulobacter vibrioides]AZH12714.1 hypothetical protein EIB18_08345 [Caulobacter vibrioides]QXZ53630.1 hypothetical protein KZH45_08185 [Caulobacter vibrioides]
MRELVTAAVLATALPFLAEAGELDGPGRFCGYSPIIDLLPGERITTLDGGIHSGSFRWEGAFGSLDVRGIGWANPPKGRVVEAQTGAKPARFAQRRTSKRYEVAIWNGGHGVAYFSSAKPLSADQLKAIGRVQLFEEGQDPSGCKLRTSFSWE